MFLTLEESSAKVPTIAIFRENLLHEETKHHYQFKKSLKHEHKHYNQICMCNGPTSDLVLLYVS